MNTTYLILFSATLAFIVPHLYSWLLGWFCCPEAYRDHFYGLFPAQRSVGVISLLQVFEFPYLLRIGDRDTLLYVNAFPLSERGTVGLTPDTETSFSTTPDGNCRYQLPSDSARAARMLEKIRSVNKIYCCPLKFRNVSNIRPQCR